MNIKQHLNEIELLDKIELFGKIKPKLFGFSFIFKKTNFRSFLNAVSGFTSSVKSFE